MSKTIKVEFTELLDNNTLVVRSLIGKDAETWSKASEEEARMAGEAGFHYSWESLNWQDRYIDPSETQIVTNSEDIFITTKFPMKPKLNLNFRKDNYDN